MLYAWRVTVVTEEWDCRTPPSARERESKTFVVSAEDLGDIQDRYFFQRGDSIYGSTSYLVFAERLEEFVKGTGDGSSEDGDLRHKGRAIYDTD